MHAITTIFLKVFSKSLFKIIYFHGNTTFLKTKGMLRQSASPLNLGCFTEKIIADALG